MNSPIQLVESGEYRVSNERLATYSASTCVIMAALNARDRNGLLGHFTADDLRQGELVARAVRAIPLLGPGEDTLVRFGGGGVYFPNTAYPEAREQNEKIVQRVRRMAVSNGIPPRNIEVGWLWGNDEASAVVDPVSGVIVIVEEFKGYLTEPM